MGGLPQAARKSRRSIGGLLCVFRLCVVVFCSGKHIIIIIIIRFHRRREREEWSRETHQREEFELASGRKDGVGRTRDKPRRTTIEKEGHDYYHHHHDDDEQQQQQQQQQREKRRQRAREFGNKHYTCEKGFNKQSDVGTVGIRVEIRDARKRAEEDSGEPGRRVERESRGERR